MDVIGNPRYLKAFHGWSTVFWIPFTILAFFIGWLESVTFVSLVSMVALFLGSFSSWQGSRTEVKQEEVSETRDDKKFKLHKRRPTINRAPRALRQRRKLIR